MTLVNLGVVTEACLSILANRFKAETGNDITIAEALDGVVHVTFYEIYGED